MDEENKNFTFAGFSSPNTTPVPDQFFDFLLGRLSGAEIKVLLYIIRRTFGFKKSSDDISFSQICTGIVTRDGRVLDEGTGLSKSTAQVAIKGLLDKQVIRAIKRQSAERGNEPTTYTLNILEANTPYTENRHRLGTKIGIALYRKSATQQTVEQDTVNNVNVAFQPSKKNAGSNDAAEADLLDRIITTLGDRNPKSAGTFRRIIRTLGTSITTRLLSNTQEAYELGSVKPDKLPAYFVGMAKNVAKENGLNLGFKVEAKRAEAVASLGDLKSQIGNRSEVNSHRSYA